MLNIVLSFDTKGVSTIYKMLRGKNFSISEKAYDKRNEKTEKRIEVFSFRKSFTGLTMCDDIYLRYIQFRTFHRRFFLIKIFYSKWD